MIDFWKDTVLPSLQGVFADIIGVLPNLLAALTIFVIGYFLARLARRLIHRVLDRVGFNRMVEKAGIASFMEKSGFIKPPSWIIGQLIFYMVILLFLLSAAESLNLNGLAATLRDFVAFMPNLITVAFILVLGVVLANFVGRLVQGAAAESGIDFAEVIGKLVSNIIIIAVVVISVSQLDIESTVLNIILASLLGAFSLAIAITLGFGTRHLSRNIVSGVYARKTFKIGQQLSIAGIEGKIVDIGTASTIIKTSDKRITIPNTMLIDQVTESDASG